MLRELKNTRQIEGEPARTWFFDSDVDLFVWFDAKGKPCGFQLAYDKDRTEHSFSWNRERGYGHYRVDDGEGGPCSSGAPLLYSNGPFKRNAVLRRFLEISAGISADIVELVSSKLRGFEGPIRD